MATHDRAWVENALRCGDTELFRQRVTESPACLAQSDGQDRTPLEIAVDYQRYDLATLCLELGADPNPPTDDCGYTVMRSAIESDRPDSLGFVESLIAHGVHVDGNRDRSLYSVPVVVAATFGQRTKLEALLDAGAVVDAREPEDGETALMVAARFDHPEIVRMLLDRGADPTNRDLTIEQSALDIAIQSDRPHAGEIVDMLRSLPGASVAWTAAGGRLDVARVFLDQCFDEEAMRHPLHTAASHGEIEAMKTLLAAGYDVDARESECGDTPLIAVARLGELDATKLLLAHGADPALANDEGTTARELVELLRIGTRGAERRCYDALARLLPPA